jgi:hypothetical protein
MFVFDSRVSEDSAICRAYAHGHRRSVQVCRARAAISPDPRFDAKELGEIDMVSMALATLDLVAQR